MLDGLSADKNLATSASFACVRELGLEGLISGSHKLSHGCLKVTNVVILVAISVKHAKFVVLDLLKEVANLDGSGPVGVLVVRDLLCGSDLYPLVASLLVDVANGVRLTHEIKFFEVPTREEKIDLH